MALRIAKFFTHPEPKISAFRFTVSKANVAALVFSRPLSNNFTSQSTGFGFFIDEEGLMVKKPQCLKARIGNYVEIGANTCIDRGSWRDTVVGDHTKIDNLVQIGHNVELGKNCMLCGQVGVAGSATIGDYVILGGRVSIRDHVCIASKVRLAANSCVTKNICEAGDYGGFPAVPIHEWRKQVASVRQTSKEFWLNKKKKFASNMPTRRA